MTTPTHSGEIQPLPDGCPACLGDGFHSVSIVHPTNPMLDTWERRTCTRCDGSGHIASRGGPVD